MNQRRRGLTRGQLEELLHELKAIDFWDRSYEAEENHDSIETFAWEARRQRKREILQKLKVASSVQPRITKNMHSKNLSL